jgi:hypothetical protein
MQDGLTGEAAIDQLTRYRGDFGPRRFDADGWL